MENFSNHPLYKKHDLDSSMNSIWEFYKSKFIPLFIVSVIMSLIVQYFSSTIDTKSLQGLTDPFEIIEKMKVYIVPFLIILVVNMFFTIVLQYYIMYNPIDSHKTILVSIYRSLFYFVPYLIVMILLGFFGTITIILGVFVFIVGMFFALLYVITLYLFILPIFIAEGLNIANVISRAFKFTHRNFWSNIGWVAVILIVIIVISIILSGIIMLPFAGNFLKTIFNSGDTSQAIEIAKNPVFMVLSALVSGLTMPILPIFAAVLYFNGRAREEQKEEVKSFTNEPEKVRVEDLYAKPYSEDHPENPENKTD